MKASLDLAARAEIAAGSSGIDLCCCNGAGMRFLVRSRNVASMVGVDATEAVVERGRRFTREEGLDDRVRFVLADACHSGLPSASADFIWSEDAWCYVPDKPTLIAEAARLVRRGGVIAFTDWVEGPAGLSDSEAQRFLGMMTFANVEDIGGYAKLLSASGCEVRICRRHRALRSTLRFVSQHDRDAVNLRRIADARVPRRAVGNAGRWISFPRRAGARGQNSASAVHRATLITLAKYSDRSPAALHHSLLESAINGRKAPYRAIAVSTPNGASIPSSAHHWIENPPHTAPVR